MEELYVKSEDIIKLMNGKDEDGLPKAGVVMSVVSVCENNAPKVLKEIEIPCSQVTVAENGGSVVVNASLDISENYAYTKVNNAIKRYEKSLESEDKNEHQEIVLVVTPLALDAKVVVAYTGLAYFEGFVNKKELRVMFAFDNNLTDVYFSEGVSRSEIEKEVEFELRKMEDDLDAQIDQLEKELKEKNDRNVYEENIKEQFNTVEMEYMTQEQVDTENPNRRYSSDFNERRYSDE